MEMLVSLAITAILLVAVMVAIDASFKAYAASAEQASTQASTRMVTERLLQLIRTGTVAGPTSTTNTAAVSGSYIYLLDSKNYFLKVEYKAASQQLWLYTWSPAGTIPSNAAIAGDSGYDATKSFPILSNVTACTFSILSWQQNNGTWVVQRGTMDLTVQPPTDSTLGLEKNAAHSAFRVVASTMPRKLQ